MGILIGTTLKISFLRIAAVTGVDMRAIQNGLCDCDNKEGIEKLKQGDENTWEQFVKCYSSRLQHDIMTSLLKRSMPDWSLQDIEQETWMIADKRIGEFNWHGKDSFYHWLRVISLYRILSRLPREKFLDNTVSFQEIDDVDGDYGYRLDRFFWLNTLVQDSPESELIVQERRTEFLKLLLYDEDPFHIEIAIRRWVERKKPQELELIYGINARVISRILWSIRKRLGALDNFLKTGSIDSNTSDRGS